MSRILHLDTIRPWEYWVPRGFLCCLRTLWFLKHITWRKVIRTTYHLEENASRHFKSHVSHEFEDVDKIVAEFHRRLDSKAGANTCGIYVGNHANKNLDFLILIHLGHSPCTGRGVRSTLLQVTYVTNLVQIMKIMISVKSQGIIVDHLKSFRRIHGESETSPEWSWIDVMIINVSWF